jgi:hypothetical protein
LEVDIMKITVYSAERGVRTLKEGITLEQYQANHPELTDVIKVKKPSLATLERWSSDCGCKAIDGCWVEPDGICGHGKPSWLLALNYI